MGAVFALITGMSWAAYNLVVRRGLETMDSGSGYIITLAVNVVANLLFLLLPLPGHGSLMTSWAAVLFFVCSGLANTLIGRLLLFKSIKVLGPSRASSWKNAAPLYTLVLGFFLLGERPKPIALVGMLGIMGGLALLSREQSRSAKQSASTTRWQTGILLGIASGMAFSAGILFRKAGLNFWPDAAVGSAIGSLAALMGFLPVAAAKGDLAKIRNASRQGLTAFLIAGCISSVAQLTTFLSLRVSMAAVTQVIAALEPLFTIALSAAFVKRQEKISAGLLGSAALVCLGVVLISR